jgi:hypothetical protein
MSRKGDKTGNKTHKMSYVTVSLPRATGSNKIPYVFLQLH